MKKSAAKSEILTRKSSNAVVKSAANIGKSASRGADLWLVGIDEAGRGPLAGPVSVGVCAVRISSGCGGGQKRNIEKKVLGRDFKNVKESKQLSAAKREEWFHRMQAHAESDDENAIVFNVQMKSAAHIDTHGIAVSIRQALAAGLAKVEKKIKERGGIVGEVRLDGGLKAPAQYTNQRTIIKGDVKEKIIALASIAAKVTRDKYMVGRAAKRHPEYGFEIHKGYGTRAHCAALWKHGMSSEHRRSFIHFL